MQNQFSNSKDIDEKVIFTQLTRLINGMDCEIKSASIQPQQRITKPLIDA